MTLPPASDLRHPTSSSASDPEVLVKVDGVSKKFCRDLKKSLWYGMKDVASELLPFGKQKSGIRDQRSANSSSSLTSDLRLPTSGDALRPGEFWANKDISFELRRGECLGLIGRNGAGKTTLLKMLNGLIKPDAGSIEMRGRVGALIALGAGFNPILTGRENIYVNGSILGLTKEEIDAKIDEIIDFAEIREFIDAPVQSYSSGMQVRLGFAVATAMDPDVLILDEVLAVGDAAFRAKCYNRIVSLRKLAAVIFVSHNMEQIGRICDRVLLLSKSQQVYDGDVGEGIYQYESLNEQGNETEKSFLSFGPDIRSFRLDIKNKEISSGDSIHFNLHFSINKKISNCVFRFVFYNTTGAIVADCNEAAFNGLELYDYGNINYKVSILSATLKHGKYYIGFGLIDGHGDLIIWSYKQYEIKIHKNTFPGVSDCQLKMIATVMND
jgi:lipopolysaccharide transport system ATP-binding protein